MAALPGALAMEIYKNEENYENEEKWSDDESVDRDWSLRPMRTSVPPSRAEPIVENYGMSTEALRRLRATEPSVAETAVPTVENATTTTTNAISSSTEDDPADDVEGLPLEEPRLPLVGEPSSAAKEEEEAESSLSRLFRPDELDAMERGKPSDVQEEKEEYDTELEERLLPLDEEDLNRRLEENALPKKVLSLGELSEYLQVPAEKLARARDEEPGRPSSLEYWLQWYRDTLTSADEAKRANRNLRAVAAGATAPPGPAVSVACPVSSSCEMPVRPLPRLPDRAARGQPLQVDESVVIANVTRPFGADLIRPASPKFSEVDELPSLPAHSRRLVRYTAYVLVTGGDVALASVKEEERARVLVRSHVRLLGETLYRRVLELVLGVYEHTAEIVRLKRTKRDDKRFCCGVSSPRQKERGLTDPAPLGDARLSSGRTAVVECAHSCSNDGDDPCNYVCFVRDLEHQEVSRKPGLREVPYQDGEDAGEDCWSPGGKRVIGSVSGWRP